MKITKVVMSVLMASALQLQAVTMSADEYKKLTSNEKFKTEMLQSAKNLTTLQSEFTQTKHISGMTKDVVSTGKFYFQKEDKLLLDYLTPMKSQIIMNGSIIVMNSGGKNMTMDANSNPSVANLKNMLSSCLSGNLPTSSKDMQLDIYESADKFRVYVLPLGGNMAKRYERIEVFLNKADYSVISVKMIEKKKTPNQKENDFMEFSFTNMKKNAAIDPSKFNTK